MVYDFYSPTTALEKSRIVILNTIRAYQSFIQSEFTLLADKLDAFYGGNLISVLVDYSDPEHKFIFHIHYFRSILPSNEKTIIIEDISESRIIFNKICRRHRAILKLLNQIMIKCANLPSTYHKIKEKYYIRILYDRLRLWQRVQWGLNCPEN